VSLHYRVKCQGLKAIGNNVLLAQILSKVA